MLLNRSHTFADLVLPIDLEQKQWLNAIDGHRTIAGSWTWEPPGLDDPAAMNMPAPSSRGSGGAIRCFSMHPDTLEHPMAGLFKITFLHFILELEISGRWPWQGAHGSADDPKE